MVGRGTELGPATRACQLHRIGSQRRRLVLLAYVQIECNLPTRARRGQVHLIVGAVVDNGTSPSTPAHADINGAVHAAIVQEDAAGHDVGPVNLELSLLAFEGQTCEIPRASAGNLLKVSARPGQNRPPRGRASIHAGRNSLDVRLGKIGIGLGGTNKYARVVGVDSPVGIRAAVDADSIELHLPNALQGRGSAVGVDAVGVDRISSQCQHYVMRGRQIVAAAAAHRIVKHPGCITGQVCSIDGKVGHVGAIQLGGPGADLNDWRLYSGHRQVRLVLDDGRVWRHTRQIEPVGVENHLSRQYRASSYGRGWHQYARLVCDGGYGLRRS